MSINTLNMIPVMIPIMIPWQTCRSSSSSTQYFLFLSLALNTSTLCIYSGAGRPVNTGISSPSDRFICHEFYICSKKELCIYTQCRRSSKYIPSDILDQSVRQDVTSQVPADTRINLSGH